ncbi:hypothetical protein E2C01_069811 [Portunus trituberculatus]|uniref:Uncharacterized protein n=1 Tax=Portunus trituberculatus TaxID=210409 RepID=A0A5B7I3S5_PORTR|nr:hypothetical protein [Portunus trituberculatus]
MASSFRAVGGRLAVLINKVSRHAAFLPNTGREPRQICPPRGSESSRWAREGPCLPPVAITWSHYPPVSSSPFPFALPLPLVPPTAFVLPPPSPKLLNARRPPAVTVPSKFKPPMLRWDPISLPEGRHIGQVSLWLPGVRCEDPGGSQKAYRYLWGRWSSWISRGEFICRWKRRCGDGVDLMMIYDQVMSRHCPARPA